MICMILVGWINFLWIITAVQVPDEIWENEFPLSPQALPTWNFTQQIISWNLVPDNHVLGKCRTTDYQAELLWELNLVQGALWDNLFGNDIGDNPGKKKRKHKSGKEKTHKHKHMCRRIVPGLGG